MYDQYQYISRVRHVPKLTLEFAPDVTLVSVRNVHPWLYVRSSLATGL